MDKIEKLEKRIEELERKAVKDDKNQSRILLQLANKFVEELVTNNAQTFRHVFLNKYSGDNLPEGSKHLDITKAIEKVKGRNCAVKLKHWKEYKKKLGNRKNLHWHSLQYFVDMAIKEYEREVIRYILQEGKYVDAGGPRERKELKKKAYKIYQELKTSNSDCFHTDGRWKGGPKWDKIEPILRDRLSLSEFESLRSIQDYIRNQEK